ncbi:hypothetical protein [Paenibacillus sp. Marseille-Q4541]|uniref:hypothetical protein n=1 Tax=Paenibacillus sp. Marseille-Q4541 TaxID=2831522 RepID=UPI001BAA369F|nr:hypothetical protein [Paenibacillus sp. Marseille-Q4541]
MSIQFLDMRISSDSVQDIPEVGLSSSSLFPYTFGDIGLQTANVSPDNVNLVRVTLNAYARLQMAPSSNPTITPNATFTIRRNGTEIFTTVYQKPVNQIDVTYEMAAITAVDFPPVEEVLAGQIQYTISVFTNYGISLGARSFSGIAVAGNT